MYYKPNSIAIMVAAAILSSCDSKPDLLPITRRGQADGPASFCEQDSLGRLVVTIKNQGLSDAPEASTTRLEFLPQGVTLIRSTPAIPVGANIDVAFDIPDEYYDPDCNFIITVDSNNDIKESNEQNNRVDGICSSIGEREQIHKTTLKKMNK